MNRIKRTDRTVTVVSHREVDASPILLAMAKNEQTIVDAAKHLNVSRQTVYKWLYGENSIPEAQYKRLKEFAGV